MKKSISSVLILAILMGLFTGCAGVNHDKSSLTEDKYTGTTEDNTVAISEDTSPSAQDTATESAALTCDALIDYLNDIASKNDHGYNFISDVERKAGEEANQTVTTFNYYAGLVAASVTETKELVQVIMTTTVPSKFSALNSSNSNEENLQYAYVACMQSLYICDPEKDEDWHLDQLNRAKEEGDASISIRNYKSNNWIYIIMLSEYFVSCSACRYCSQCQGNAPVVVFSPGAVICDTCSNSSHGNGSSIDNSSSNGGSSSNSGNTSNGGNPTTGGNTSQQPNPCSHNYTNATCTTPKTCTLCGQTSGTALGHNYSVATCTAPKTCNSCGATTGSAAGHKWTNITQTVYHEEEGHYEDVQDAKKVQKYRCWLCSYAQPTYATKDAYYAHFDSAHGNESNSSFFRERYEMVDDWVYETVTVWVVDKEAYTETVITGRKCDICGTIE